MKKLLQYLIAAVLVLAFGVLIVASTKNRLRRLDERITLRQADKIPYGTSVAKGLLSSLFPQASIYYNKAQPSDWDSVSFSESNQAVVLIADRFNADEEELSRILSFIKEGNYVFIVAKSFSYDAIETFHFSYNESSFDQFLNLSDDSLRIRLEKPVFATDKLFIYPGKKYESSFYSLDTLRTKVLGRNEDGKPNFIQMKAGKGSLFIHAAPLAFSNYFILHKNNREYYQKALSVIPPEVDKILWNEYYLIKPRTKDEKGPNWLGVLMKYPAFKWGLLTGLVTVLLFVLLGMRRMQRMIPAYERPKNDSLDFVKTIGRLYYDRKDHKNLARKMASYFLDHVRTRYKLPTQALDDEFVQNLQYKSGYPIEDLRQIIGFINNLDGMPAISENQLSRFHKQVELFYQNT
jgi:hypothetical protein